MVVALAMPVLLVTINVEICVNNNTSGGVGVPTGGLTVTYTAGGRIVSSASFVTTDIEVFNSTVVILKVEIEVTVEIGMTGACVVDFVSARVDALDFSELVSGLGNTVRVFVSSIVWVTVRTAGVVVTDNGGGELPSMSTTE